MNDKLYRSSLSSACDNTTSPSIPSKSSLSRQQSQSFDSSYSSEPDITNVSSTAEQHQYSFQLQSMRHVLLGLSTSTSRPSSPDYSHRQQLNEEKISMHKNPGQPYIHSSRNDHYRIRLTSSAINRQKQQQRIEHENLKILERLRHVRSSRSLKRDELLLNYDRQMGFNTYTTESRIRLPRQSTHTSLLSSTSSLFERNQHSQSRPSSRNNISLRPASVTSHSSSLHKPLWNDRWQQHE